MNDELSHSQKHQKKREILGETITNGKPIWKTGVEEVLGRVFKDKAVFKEAWMKMGHWLLDLKDEVEIKNLETNGFKNIFGNVYKSVSAFVMYQKLALEYSGENKRRRLLEGIKKMKTNKL